MTKQNLFYLMLGGLIVFLVLHQCEGKETPRQGTLISKEREIIHDTIVLTEFKSKTIDVIRWRSQKDSLVYVFENLPCTDKDSVYSHTIEPKMFQWQTEDENLIADIRGITTGEVKHIELNYLIKPDPKAKDKHFSLSAGVGGVLNNFSTPVISVGVGYKNYEIDYLRINNQDFATLKYRIRF